LVKVITTKAKVFFCSDLHRFADANAKNKAAKKLRQANPNSLACENCHGKGYTRPRKEPRKSQIPSWRKRAIGNITDYRGT